jgi:hypothetical protein
MGGGEIMTMALLYLVIGWTILVFGFLLSSPLLLASTIPIFTVTAFLAGVGK